MQERRSRDLRGIHQVKKRAKSRARHPVRHIGRIVLYLCFLAAACAPWPGFAQTLQTSTPTFPNGPTPPETASTTNPSASPWFPPTLLVPQITPLTNPAVISPQAQLD